MKSNMLKINCCVIKTVMWHLSLKKVFYKAVSITQAASSR